jgi:hypothetical protein
MLPRNQAFPDLRFIIDEIGQRLPAAIDFKLNRIGLESMLKSDQHKLARDAIAELLSESEYQHIQEDDVYDDCDIAEFVEIEIALLLAERINKGRTIAEIAADPISLTALQGALQYFMDLEESPPESENKTDGDVASSIVRKAGEQVIDKSLEGMQAAYYAITNSYWCRAKGAVQLSAVCAVLSDSWDGIGEFRR